MKKLYLSSVHDEVSLKKLAIYSGCGHLLCFGGGYFVRKLFKLNWKLSNLISAGTGICGGSAVAAIGLSASISDFKKAGLAPMFYGITIDTLVTITALVVIWFMALGGAFPFLG